MEFHRFSPFSCPPSCVPRCFTGAGRSRLPSVRHSARNESMNAGSNNGAWSTLSRTRRVCLAIRTRSTNTKLMAGLDLAERKLAEIGRGVVIIHDLVQLSRCCTTVSIKKLCRPCHFYGSAAGKSGGEESVEAEFPGPASLPRNPKGIPPWPAALWRLTP